MNIVIVHGYAHRFNTAGVMESAPVYKEVKFHEEEEAYVLDGPWLQRTPESMDLSGGDYSEIMATVSRFASIFQDGTKRIPESMKKSAQPQNEVVTR